MAAPIVGNIKQIDLDPSHGYEIQALHFINGSLDTPSQWKEYIDSAATAGFKFIVCSNAENTPKGVTFTPKGASAAVTGALEANDAQRGIYLVYHPHEDGKDSYDEYIAAGEGVGAFWEKLGNTDIDLSGKADKGTYTSTAPSTNTTGSAGAETATGSATITYKKSATATESTGSTATANSGNAGAVTIDGSNFTFTPETKNVSVSITKSSGASVGNHSYQPEGDVTVSHDATKDSTITVLTGVKVASSTNVIDSVSAGTAATKKGVRVSTSAAETGTVNVSYTKQALTGTTSFNTDAIKEVNLAGTTVSTDGPAYIESISGSAPTLGGQKAVPTNAIKSVTLSASTTSTDGPEYVESVTLPTMTAINFTKNTLQSLTTKNYGFETSTADVMYAPTVSNGVLSWSTKTSGTQDVLSAGSQASLTGGVFTAGSKATKYMKNTTTAADTANVTISGGSYSGTTKYLKPSYTAAGKGTVAISDGAVSLTGTTTFAKSGLASAALAEDTSTTPAFAFNTDAIKDVSSTTTSVAVTVGANGTTPVISAIGGLSGSFVGTTATLTHSVTDAAYTGSFANADIAGTIGGTQTVAAHSHTYVSLPAHTHAITLTDTSVTGTAAVAVSAHTHSLSNHTHSVTI